MNQEIYFIDANIWLYCFLSDQDIDPSEEKRKRQIAISLTQNKRSIVSTQVINEVCSVLMRKAALSESQIIDIIDDFTNKCIVIQLTIPILKNASHLRTKYHFSFWDSLIVASALASATKIIYSEDMQDGLLIEDQIQIINPFKK